MGRIEPGAEGQARNVTKNRDNGMLVAIKGWQDPPKKHGGWQGNHRLKGRHGRDVGFRVQGLGLVLAVASGVAHAWQIGGMFTEGWQDPPKKHGRRQGNQGGGVPCLTEGGLGCLRASLEQRGHVLAKFVSGHLTTLRQCQWVQGVLPGCKCL